MGWTGKLLWIDLSSGTSKTEELPPEVLHQVIGGKGLGAYLLLKYLDPSTDPLHPDNMLVISTGPAQGTMSIAGRYTIVTKSPHTGIFIDSHVGGYLGPELKFAGYDAVIITGRAETPSYIRIDDDTVTIIPAEHLWGKDIIETTDIINNEFDSKARIVAIGPAGENLVHFAATNSDYYRTAARGGVGMVFGSKNLKAVAVRGRSTLPDTNLPMVKTIRQQINQRAKSSHDKGHRLPQIGTSWLVPIASARDQMPTLNYQRGEWEHADEISGDSLEEHYGENIKRKPCYRCSLACAYVID
ncbi:MAG: aldehyde ferredoxin oxidoreductase N-terminal domain-containing protein, partial [Candidatus Kariarchaeaceae archaeon]